MRKEIYIAEVSLIITELERSIKSIESKIEKNNAKRDSNRKTIIVKGFEVDSMNTLDELIAADVINSNEYTRYAEKLKKVQKEVSFAEKQEALEAALEYFNKELSNARMNLE